MVGGWGRGGGSAAPDDDDEAAVTAAALVVGVGVGARTGDRGADGTAAVILLSTLAALPRLLLVTAPARRIREYGTEGYRRAQFISF